MHMRRSALTVLAVAAIGIAAGLFFFHRTAHAQPRFMRSIGTAQSSAAQQSGGSDKMPTLSFAADPEAIPPFQARDISGGVVSTTGLKGKAVIINFWATWCGPCREEIPELIALQAQFKDSLQIIGISEDEVGPEQVAKFAHKAGINYPIIMATDALEKEYGGVSALPTSFLVNKDGRVVQKNVGVIPFDYYNLQIRALMGLPVNAHIETFKDTGQIFLKNAARASELPGVSFAGLTAAQKKIALHRLNAENCDCGCKLTLAECRINDTQCPVSGAAAMKVVRSVARSNPASTAPVKPKPSATP